jgi:hypothetical protein
MAPECWFRLERARATRRAPKQRFGDPSTDFSTVRQLERLEQGPPCKHDRIYSALVPMLIHHLVQPHRWDLVSPTLDLNDTSNFVFLFLLFLPGCYRPIMTLLQAPNTEDAILLLSYVVICNLGGLRSTYACLASRHNHLESAIITANSFTRP